MDRFLKVLLLLLIGACGLAYWYTHPIMQTYAQGLIITQDGKYLVDSELNPLQIHHYRVNHNPTFAQVMAFARDSHISEKTYLPNHYMCSEFARDTHDAAEAAGLRCAFVSITFSAGIGHTLVAFHTTDRGLVFLDLTGGTEYTEPGTYTTIGYLKLGQVYGRLPLDIAEADPNHYERYVKTIQLWEKLKQYNEGIKADKQYLDVKQAELDRHLAQIKQDQAQANNPSAQAVLNARIERYNLDVQALKQACEDINQRVEVYNRSSKLMERHYSVNQYPVVEVQFWF